MRKVFVVSTFLFLFLFCFQYFAAAENLEQVMDKFYNGLADIIENNMNNPDECVRKTDEYYKSNQAAVLAIKKESEKAMQQAKSMADAYSSVSMENFAALQEQAGKDAKQAQENMPKGVKRYSELLADFTQKHPRHALKIAMNAMQLVPDMNNY